MLGILALVAGGLIILVAFSFAPGDPDRIYGLAGTAMLDAALFGLGYFLLLGAHSIRDGDDDADDYDASGARLHSLGKALLFVVLVEIMLCMPFIGRMIMLAVILLTYARFDRDWSSKEVVGKTTFGEIYDFVVMGALYLLINVIWLGLTAGRGGVIGGGGLSGGGGASGSW